MLKIEIKNLYVSVEGKEILKDLSLTWNFGEILVVLGPNGAGKSTLSNVLMGHPKYEITSGLILFDGENITTLDAQERAKLGLFMSFQHPAEISGVTMANFLRTSYNALKETNLKTIEFQKILKEKMDLLHMDASFRRRSINAGFSGGEKKRSEILQLLLFEPKFAILDEVDSGLDVDALKIVSQSISKVQKETKMGIFIITHYNKILSYVKADRVIILKAGKIVREGGAELIKEVEEKGFE